MELAGSKEFSEEIFILIECLNAEKPAPIVTRTSPN
jgi:hypothetical protein